MAFGIDIALVATVFGFAGFALSVAIERCTLDVSNLLSWLVGDRNSCSSELMWFRASGAFLLLAYFTVAEGLFGATVGKRIAGLRVINRLGERPGLRAAFVRNVLRVVDIALVSSGVGVLMFLESLKFRRPGDHLAKTAVVPVDWGNLQLDEFALRPIRLSQRERTSR